MATNVMERAEGNASAVSATASDLPWPFSIYIAGREEKGEECFPRPRAIHFRAKLSRGGIAIKRSVSLAASSSPSPRYLRNHSRATTLSTIFILRPPSAPPCHRFALRRRVRRAAFRWAYFPARCDRPLHNRCAVTRRGRGREKDYGVVGAGG